MVAARLGCVNWNQTIVQYQTQSKGRSPLGLRELKRKQMERLQVYVDVAARLGCVNWNGYVPRYSEYKQGRSPLGLRELKRTECL